MTEGERPDNHQESPHAPLDSEFGVDMTPALDGREEAPEGPEVPFERIKQDILDHAEKDATVHTDRAFFGGFYNHDLQRYSRVTEGDFSEGYDQSKVEYDENLTPEQTDEIRSAVYEKFGAIPPPDDEFNKQKKKSEGWPPKRDATVMSATDRPGLYIRETRIWRELHEDVAAEHNRDPLDFTMWGMAIVNENSGANTTNATEGQTQEPEDTAREMAYASQERRGHAANRRAQLRFMGEYAGAVKEARKGWRGRRARVDELFSNDPRFDHWTHHDDDERFRTGRDIDDERFNMKYAVQRGFESSRGRERLAQIRENLTEEARRADERAEGQEAWAKILHEKPPSEAFKAAYPHEKIGPNSLELTEGWLPQDLEQLEALREGIDSKEETPSARNWAIDWLDSLYYQHAPQELLDDLNSQLDQLDASVSTTNGQYMEFYKKTLSAYVENQEKVLRDRTQMLEDLRSGKAADPNYQKSASEPASTTETAA